MNVMKKKLALGPVFGYLMFTIFFLLSFKIYQTFKTEFWPHFQIPQSWSKILRYASYFQLSCCCLEKWSKTVLRVRYFVAKEPHADVIEAVKQFCMHDLYVFM